MSLKYTLSFKYLMMILFFVILSCTDAPFTPLNTGSIKGQVLDEDTQLGIPGVFINASPVVGSTLTDNYGYFCIENIPEEQYAVNFKKNGYNNATQNVMLKTGYHPHLTILLKKTTALTGTIKGTVFSQDEQPLSKVCISTLPGTSIVLTDNNGQYQLTEVPEGIYKITAVKPGYNDLTLDLTVNKSKETIADFILENK